MDGITISNSTSSKSYLLTNNSYQRFYSNYAPFIEVKPGKYLGFTETTSTGLNLSIERNNKTYIAIQLTKTYINFERTGGYTQEYHNSSYGGTASIEMIGSTSAELTSIHLPSNTTGATSYLGEDMYASGTSVYITINSTSNGSSKSGTYDTDYNKTFAYTSETWWDIVSSQDNTSYVSESSVTYENNTRYYYTTGSGYRAENDNRTTIVNCATVKTFGSSSNGSTAETINKSSYESNFRTWT